MRKGTIAISFVFAACVAIAVGPSAKAFVTVRIQGWNPAGAHCHLTDIARTYAEVPLEVGADGLAILHMQPLSFALIEW